jgi:hypothetical protein
MKKGIYTFVAKCEACQRNKGEIMKTIGPFQPQPILVAIWVDLSMDFKLGLLKASKKYNIIMVVDEYLSRYVHCCSIPHSFTTLPIAKLSSWIRFVNDMAHLIPL